MLFYVHDLLFFNAYYDHKFNKVSPQRVPQVHLAFRRTVLYYLN